MDLVIVIYSIKMNFKYINYIIFPGNSTFKPLLSLNLHVTISIMSIVVPIPKIPNVNNHNNPVFFFPT